MEKIVVSVTLDGQLFRNFATFDVLKRTGKQKRMLRIVSFALAAAVVLLALGFLRDWETARTWGFALVAIGSVMPLIYMGMFKRSLRYQISRNDLVRGRYVYTIVFDERDGVIVQDTKERLSYTWRSIFFAYRADDAIYLYAEQKQAYILPNNQIEEGADALWDLFTQMIDEEKLEDIRN